MGSTNTKMKIPTELTESEIEILKLNTNMTHNEVCTWYKEFYEFSNGRLLDQGHFIKYYKDLLPYKGDPEEFCKLAFNGRVLFVFLKNLLLRLKIVPLK